MEIAQAFFAASRGGDIGALQALLADDIALYSDGGGKRPAALVPVFGIERVMLLFRKLAQILAGTQPPHVSYGYIDGLPGFVTQEADGVPQSTALEIRDGKIAGIYVVRNPEKLRHLAPTALQ